MNPPSDHDYTKGGRRAHLVLTVLTGLYMLNYMDRSVMSVVLEPMKRSLGLSDAQLGVLQTVFLLGVGLLMIPGGILVDR